MSAVVLSGDTSGTITLQAPLVAGSNTQTLVATTGTLAPIVSGTAQASTSGTSILFTGIPSWAKRITVMFNGVSTSGNGGLRVQIGTSGGIQTTGYSGANGVLANSNVTATSSISAGFDCQGLAATSLLSGTCVLTLVDSSSGIWVATFVLADSAQVRTFNTCGTKTLSGALDRVNITTVNGTDTFDAGSINILYE